MTDNPQNPSASQFQLMMQLTPLLGREVAARSEDGYVALAMSGTLVRLTLDPRCIDPQQPQHLADVVVLTYQEARVELLSRTWAELKRILPQQSGLAPELWALMGPEMERGWGQIAGLVEFTGEEERIAGLVQRLRDWALQCGAHPHDPGLARMVQQTRHRFVREHEERVRLDQLRLEGRAGQGQVCAVLNGHGRLVALHLDPRCLDPQEPERLARWIVEAIAQGYPKPAEPAPARAGGGPGDIEAPWLGDPNGGAAPEVYVFQEGRLVREEAPGGAAHSVEQWKRLAFQAGRDDWRQLQRRQEMKSLYQQKMGALMTAFPAGPPTPWIVLVDAPDKDVYYCFPDRTGDLSDSDQLCELVAGLQQNQGRVSEHVALLEQAWIAGFAAHIPVAERRLDQAAIDAVLSALGIKTRLIVTKEVNQIR